MQRHSLASTHHAPCSAWFQRERERGSFPRCFPLRGFVCVSLCLIVCVRLQMCAGQAGRQKYNPERNGCACCAASREGRGGGGNGRVLYRLVSLRLAMLWVALLHTCRLRLFCPLPAMKRPHFLGVFLWAKAGPGESPDPAGCCCYATSACHSLRAESAVNRGL